MTPAPELREVKVEPYYERDGITIYHGAARHTLESLASESVNCCVTSPPYWGLRDYGAEGQIGLEKTPEAYVERMVDVFRGVKRVLRDDGTLWLNLGDSYTSGDRKVWRSGASENKGQNVLNDADHRPKTPPGLKPKDLVGIPWRVAFALQADGWYLRQDIIWHKPNPMPESVTDRCTKAHEYIFLLSKSARYYYDADAISDPAINAGGTRKQANHAGTQAQGKGVIPSGNQKPGSVTVYKDTRNKRSVWTVTTKPYSGAHFATFPPDLIEPCIKAGCPEGGTVLDPFLGSGTTAMVAQRFGRKTIGIELNQDYCEIAANRLRQGVLDFSA